MKVIKFGDMYKFALEVNKRRIVYLNKDWYEYYYDWVPISQGYCSWQDKLNKHFPETRDVVVSVIKEY